MGLDDERALRGAEALDAADIAAAERLARQDPDVGACDGNERRAQDVSHVWP
jgi:hypothetical protein